MTSPAWAAGAAAAAGAALLWWCWLRSTPYRRPGDGPRLPARRSWAVIPAAAAMAWVLAHSAGWDPALPALVMLSVGGPALAWTDVDVLRIPNQVLQWWAPAVLLLGAIAAWYSHGWAQAAWGLLLGLAAGIFWLVVALVSPLGMGDVKLGAVLGAGVACWRPDMLLPAMFCGVVIGMGAGLATAARRRSWHVVLPYGPAMVAGLPAAAILVHP